MAKATYWTETDVEARKCGEQTGLPYHLLLLLGGCFVLRLLLGFGLPLMRLRRHRASYETQHLVFIVYGVDYQGI